jgi:peptidoglycan/LPS O-acetylase OafA/YrhL
MKYKPVQQNNKLLGLEVIRFISAFSVLVWHYQHFFYINDKLPTNFVKEYQPLYHFLSLFYDYGNLGVEVFWCISGFIFFWKYREMISSKTITYKKFFVLRFSRLYPLHFFTLMLVVFLQAVYKYKIEYFFVYQNNDIAHFIYQLFLASNWGLEKGYSFNGPIWSISVEALVYCFFFLVLQKISKSFLVNVAVLLICLSAKYFNVTNVIFNCLAFFYVGGLSAISLKYIQGTKYAKQILYMSLFFLLTYPLVVYITNIYQHKYVSTPKLLLMSYLPVLLFFSAQRFNVAPFIQKTIEATGNITYSSYLIHYPLQLAIAIFFMFAEKEIPYYSEIFFAGFIFTTLFASHYIYKLFELPVQNRIRKKLSP